LNIPPGEPLPYGAQGVTGRLISLPRPADVRYHNTMSDAQPTDAAFVQQTRRKLRMTQAEFATAYGINVKRLRDLEQGRHKADGALVNYVRVIRAMPVEVRGVLRAAEPPALSRADLAALRR
jgi:DNA-binding transcriptional regulator YiaG